MAMSKEEHKPGQDGILEDGVNYYPADPHDMATFEVSSKSLAQMQVPVFHHAGSAHERLFVAAFDGTWNDAEKNPTHLTNVGGVKNQIELLKERDNRNIEIGYVKGVGTQSNWLVKTLDGAAGYTYDQRLEEMYEKFAKQAAKWLKEDPNAKIRLADIGFSRGAEQAAGFARLVHERGIQDPSGIATRRDESGRTIIEYSKPPLIPPGQIAQAVGLFDPVGTGEPRNHDRRLPPSVISGFQITAEDERRGLFKSTSILDQGMTADGRFLAVMVGGAHSDIGGGYHRNGLAIRAGNLMTDYLNTLSDTPILQKKPEPSAPGMNVVHRSEEGMLLYRLWQKVDRQHPDGVVETLAPSEVCRKVADCKNAEPRDEALAARFDFAKVAIGPAPAETKIVDLPIRSDATQPGHPDHALMLQSVSAVQRLDSGMHRSHDIYSDRLATGLAVAAKQAGLQRIDHVVLSDKGDYAFAVQGDLDSPTKRLARIDTNTVTNTPVDAGLRQINALNDEQTREVDRQQLQPQATILPSPQEQAPVRAIAR